MEPQIKITKHEYFSRHASYAGVTDADLELTVKTYENDAVVRIELLNRQHGSECKEQLRRLWILITLATVYFPCVWKKCTTIWQASILAPSFGFTVAAIYILYYTMNLVQSEKLFYSWDFALQTETVRTLGRETGLCLQRGNLHDMVLNEVIENLDVKYILLVRTKGSIFKRKPVIPLFNNHSPSFECLQHIYRILHGHWLHNDDYNRVRAQQAYNMSKPDSAAS